jgi:small subunit ribosomal protein S6
MRNYEVAFIVHPELNEEAMSGLIDRVKGWITGSGGVVGEIDQWGRRRLAYAIRRQSEGQYVFVPAQLPTQATRELERNLRLTEPIMRFMITLVE